MKNRRFNQAAYKRNCRKALGRHLREGETTAINDGVFCVYGYHGIIGRVPEGEWEVFIR